MELTHIEEFDVEAVLEELLILKDQIKPIIKRISEIEEWCKNRGSFNTANYVCVVKPQSRKQAASCDILVSKLGDEDMLFDLGIIRTVNYLIVSVGRKSD